jgi:hypothetical protein
VPGYPTMAINQRYITIKQLQWMPIKGAMP